MWAREREASRVYFCHKARHGKRQIMCASVSVLIKWWQQTTGGVRARKKMHPHRIFLPYTRNCNFYSACKRKTTKKYGRKKFWRPEEQNNWNKKLFLHLRSLGRALQRSVYIRVEFTSKITSAFPGHWWNGSQPYPRFLEGIQILYPQNTRNPSGTNYSTRWSSEYTQFDWFYTRTIQSLLTTKHAEV